MQKFFLNHREHNSTIHGTAVKTLTNLWTSNLKQLAGSSAVGQGYSKRVPLLMISVKCPEKLRFLPCCDVSYHIVSMAKTTISHKYVQPYYSSYCPKQPGSHHTIVLNVLMSQIQYYKFSATLLSEFFVQVDWFFPFHLILFSSCKRCYSCSPVLGISLKS